MSHDKFAQFAEIEEQLRMALNGELEVNSSGPVITKTAARKLAKAARKKRVTFVHQPLARSFAHIVITARKPWGGRLVRIDYTHTNCSLFEAQLKVDRMIADQHLVFHALLKKEVCENAQS